MQITKKNLLDYHLIPQIIEKDQEKLKHYKENPPVAIHGKVTGSNSVFPYQLRSFTVSGPDFQEQQNWKMKIRYLEVKLQSEIKFYNNLKLELDTAIASLDDMRMKLVIEYTLLGKTQEWIANKVFLERSSVSREIDRFIKWFNDKAV